MNEVLYIRVVYAVLIFTFVFCGVLRSCNLFPHAIKSMDEYFPARKLVVSVYFSVLLLLPCLLHPLSPDARLLERCFWILYIPASASLAFKLFFQAGRRHNKWLCILAGGVPAMVLLILSVSALAGKDILQPHKHAILISTEILSAALTLYLVHVTLWMWRLISAHPESKAETAYKDTIPRHFALGIFWLPIVVQAVAWRIHLSGSVWENVAFVLATDVIGAAILVVILHPQRAVADNSNPSSCESKTQESIDEEPLTRDVCTEEEKEETTMRLPVPMVDKMERQLRDLLEGERLYLKPDLTKSELVSRLGTNDLYLHIVLKQRFGAFNRYVNTLRLEHAMRYEKQHPEAKREEVAMKSGFGSVRTYYRAKKLYGKWIQEE